MNHKFSRLLSILALVGVLTLTGCVSTHPADDQTKPNSPPDTVWTADGDTEPERLKAVLTECMSMIGKDDAETASLLGGGQEHRTEDGCFLRGRIYDVNVFGEPTKVITLYDNEQSVDCVTMRLKSTDMFLYLEQLRAVYGEPKQHSEKPTENGVTWTYWQIDNTRITLFEKGDSVVLELRREQNV